MKLVDSHFLFNVALEHSTQTTAYSQLAANMHGSSVWEEIALQLIRCIPNPQSITERWKKQTSLQCSYHHQSNLTVLPYALNIILIKKIVTGTEKFCFARSACHVWAAAWSCGTQQLTLGWACQGLLMSCTFSVACWHCNTNKLKGWSYSKITRWRMNVYQLLIS